MARVVSVWMVSCPASRDRSERAAERVRRPRLSPSLPPSSCWVCVLGDETSPAAAASPATAAGADPPGVQPPSGSLQERKVWPALPQFAQT